MPVRSPKLSGKFTVTLWYYGTFLETQNGGFSNGADKCRFLSDNPVFSSFQGIFNTFFITIKKAMSNEKKHVMPITSPTARALRDMDPESLLINLPVEVAQQILDEWRVARSEPGMTGTSVVTAKRYTENAERMERKYSAEQDVAWGCLSPVECVRAFFFKSKEISIWTWKNYRQSLLFMLDRRAIDMDAQGTPQKSLVMALACLIIVSRPPSESAPVVKHKRVKTITAKRFEAVITHLAIGYSNANRRARLTQSFAMATLATGLRPTEWKFSVLRPATREDDPSGASIKGVLAIDVISAKRKGHESEWPRTLLIDPGPYQIHIRQHYDGIMAYVAQAKNKDQPDKLYIRHSSATLALACKTLWPTMPERWITLYSLRSQARANFARRHGVCVASAMLGHSVSKSGSYYAGLTRSNLPTSNNPARYSITVPRPGVNVLAKALQIEADERRRKENPELMDRVNESDRDDEEVERE